MFHSCVSFIYNISIPACSNRLSRAIHQDIFSRLVDAQFADCMTCVTFCFGLNTKLYFRQFIYVWVWIFLNMFHSYVSFICNLSIPVCLHRLSHHRQPPKRVGSMLLVCKCNLSSHLFVGTHSCFYHSFTQHLHHPVQDPPTIYLSWSQHTLLHPKSGVCSFITID